MPPSASPSKLQSWLRRVGVAGFLFFLGKGLIWLFLGAAVVEGCTN